MTHQLLLSSDQRLSRKVRHTALQSVRGNLRNSSKLLNRLIQGSDKPVQRRLIKSAELGLLILRHQELVRPNLRRLINRLTRRLVQQLLTSSRVNHRLTLKPRRGTNLVRREVTGHRQIKLRLVRVVLRLNQRLNKARRPTLKVHRHNPTNDRHHREPVRSLRQHPDLAFAARRVPRQPHLVLRIPRGRLTLRREQVNALIEPEREHREPVTERVIVKSHSPRRRQTPHQRQRVPVHHPARLRPLHLSKRMTEHASRMMKRGLLLPQPVTAVRVPLGRVRILTNPVPLDNRHLHRNVHRKTNPVRHSTLSKRPELIRMTPRTIRRRLPATRIIIVLPQPCSVPLVNVHSDAHKITQ